MSSEMDKFTYSTTYRQDYGRHDLQHGIDPGVEPGQVNCAAKAYAGEAVGRPYESPYDTCACRPGGNMPQRGAVANGLPTNLDKTCCFQPPCTGGPSPPVPQTQTAAPSPCKRFNQENLAEMMFKAAETGNIKENYIPAQCTKPASLPNPAAIEQGRPVPIGHFGGQFEGPVNREPTSHQGAAYTYDKPCHCPPGMPESGPQDYGPSWIRERANEPVIDPRMTGGNRMNITPDLARLVNPEPPAARVSCAPESNVSNFDQPNTFMKKLYEKYPYLYQILRDTPPEELISRVFKDRFLTTYQVDYLHMGVGKEQFPKSGPSQKEKFVSPEGEPEPDMIPGCNYRPTKKGDFGKKKSTLKKREMEEVEDEAPPPLHAPKEEPRISEYMASISKLGGEIITDKLYAAEALMKKAASKNNT